MRRSGRCPSWGHAPRWAPGDCESAWDVRAGSQTRGGEHRVRDALIKRSHQVLTRIGGRELRGRNTASRGKHARRPLLPLPPRHRLLRLLMAQLAALGQPQMGGYATRPCPPSAPPIDGRRRRHRLIASSARPPLSRSRPPRLTCEPHHHHPHTHAPRISLDRTRRPRTVRSRTRRTIAGYISWPPLALAPLSLTHHRHDCSAFVGRMSHDD